MPTFTITTLPVVDAMIEEIARRDLTVRDAGELLGVSHGTVHNWLKGSTTPVLDADNQAAFAEFLGVTPRTVVELFGISTDGEVQDVPALASGQTGP